MRTLSALSTHKYSLTQICAARSNADDVASVLIDLSCRGLGFQPSLLCVQLSDVPANASLFQWLAATATFVVVQPLPVLMPAMTCIKPAFIEVIHAPDITTVKLDV